MSGQVFDNGLSLGEQLYTARGSQSMLLGALFADKLSIPMDGTFITYSKPDEGLTGERTQMRPLGFIRQV